MLTNSLFSHFSPFSFSLMKITLPRVPKDGTRT